VVGEAGLKTSPGAPGLGGENLPSCCVILAGGFGLLPIQPHPKGDCPQEPKSSMASTAAKVGATQGEAPKHLPLPGSSTYSFKEPRWLLDTLSPQMARVTDARSTRPLGGGWETFFPGWQLWPFHFSGIVTTWTHMSKQLALQTWTKWDSQQLAESSTNAHPALPITEVTLCPSEDCCHPKLMGGRTSPKTAPMAKPSTTG
jgi:hypothetical protein